MLLFLSQSFYFGTWSLAFSQVRNEKEFGFHHSMAVISVVLAMSVLFVEGSVFLVGFSVYTVGLLREIDESRYILTYDNGKTKYLKAIIFWPKNLFGWSALSKLAEE